MNRMCQRVPVALPVFLTHSICVCECVCGAFTFPLYQLTQSGPCVVGSVLCCCGIMEKQRRRQKSTSE